MLSPECNPSCLMIPGLSQVSQQKCKLMFVVSAKSAYYKHNDCASCVSPRFITPIQNSILYTQNLILRTVAVRARHCLAPTTQDCWAVGLSYREGLRPYPHQGLTCTTPFWVNTTLYWAMGSLATLLRVAGL